MHVCAFSKLKEKFSVGGRLTLSVGLNNPDIVQAKGFVSAIVNNINEWFY